MAYGGWINGVWATGLRRLGSLSSPIVWPGLSNFPLLFLNIYIYTPTIKRKEVVVVVLLLIGERMNGTLQKKQKHKNGKRHFQ